MDRKAKLIHLTEEDKRVLSKQAIDKGLDLKNYIELFLHKLATMPVIDAADIIGLELTEEWMQKLGFSKTDNVWRNKHHMFLDKWYISQKEKHGVLLLSVIMFGGYVRHIKYVHELQNLYFALTGEELEFSR